MIDHLLVLLMGTANYADRFSPRSPSLDTNK